MAFIVVIGRWSARLGVDWLTVCLSQGACWGARTDGILSCLKWLKVIKRVRFKKRGQVVVVVGDEPRRLPPDLPRESFQ